MSDNNVWRTLDDIMWGVLKGNWLHTLLLPFSMVELPMRRERPSRQAERHRASWVIDWGWPIAGLVFGAFIARPLLELVGLTNHSYSGAFEIGITVSAASLVQFAGLLFVTLVFHVMRPVLEWMDEHIGDWWLDGLVGPMVALGFAVPVLIVPLVGVGYGVYRYFAWAGPGQHTVTVAFVGGLLVTMLIAPVIRGIVTSKLFKFIISWLRAEKAKALCAWWRS